MTEITPWLDRIFECDFPVGLYPNVLARVRGTAPRLEEAVQGLSLEQLIRKHEGKWSIQENVGHLLDVENLLWHRLQEYISGAVALTPATYQNIELKHNERAIQTLLSDFRVSRQRQMNLLVGLQPEAFGITAWHPRLKVQMRLVDHLLFMAEHDDHHIARIWELRPRKSL